MMFGEETARMIMSQIYASMLQANSDGDTMHLFLTEFIKTLDF